MSTTLSRPTFRRTTGEEYPQMNAIFGTGKDGAGVINSFTTLTRDMYYTTLTVNADLWTYGYRIFATQYIKINSPGKIINDGEIGSSVDSIGLLGGGKGAFQVTYDTTIGLIRGGGEGGAGQNSTGIDGESIIGIGGGGGSGGGNFAGGGAGGTSTVASTSGGGSGGFHPIKSPFHAALMLGIASNLKVGGGGGGGGGGGEDTFGAGVGGNGGGGGGIVLLVTPKVIGNGTITAVGGDGVEAPDPVIGGGGGGGGGGAIVMITKSPYQSTLTLNVNGGIGAQGPVAQAGDGGVGSIINVVIQ